MDSLKQFIFLLSLLLGFGSFANFSSGESHLLFTSKTGVQNNLVTGKVIDKTTGEPIPHCNVALLSSPIGTATNELGEFILEVDALPASLVFSHLNYSRFQLEVSKTSDLVIALNPLTTLLEEVVVSASKEDELALELAKKAFEKAEKTAQKDFYGRAFYRQKSKNGNLYSEFSEIFYDIRYNAGGIKDWNIVEGRYALRDNEIFNRNFTVFSRLLKPLQPRTDDLIFPLRSDLEAFYSVNIMDIVQSKDAKLALVRFTPLETNSKPTFGADVYIDMDTYDIMKIKGTLTNDNITLVKLSTKEGYWKDYSITYDINYIKDSISSKVLDYIKIDQSFDYYKQDTLQYHSTTTSNLTFYEHYTTTSRKKLGGRLRTKQSDWKKLDEIGYNEQFWENNPIVKRTPIEKEVISAFEKNNSFSSIFLNSDENIALMNSNIASDPLIVDLSKQTGAYVNNNPVEKVFLHTDKNLFSAAENIWYSAYVVLGPVLQYTEASQVLYVDLINPKNELVQSQTHELIAGRAIGHLELPRTLESGIYQLRSYTKWMRNFSPDFFFTKNIEILNDGQIVPVKMENTDKIDLQFFPEGGDLIAGIPSKVAFKAIGNDGHDKIVKGIVKDAAGKQLAAFATLDRGAGFFQLLPMADERYTAILENGQEYPLPNILAEGYALNAANLNDKTIKLSVRASESLRKKAFYIVGHMNQRKYYQSKFEFGKTDIIQLEIPKSKMPSGVLTLTLFDEDKKPWCERAVFVNKREELLIGAKVNQRKYTKRNKIIMEITVTDSDGRPVSTDFSVAVTDTGQVSKDSGADNILTQLLLQSDLKGCINQPGLLFKDQNRATLSALDLVMLTHGWRRFNWPEIWDPTSTKEKFKFEKGLRLSGVAQRMDGRPLPNTSLRVISKSDDYLGMLSAQSSATGDFEIPDFNFSGDTQLVFNALNSSDKPIDLEIILDDNPTDIPASDFRGVTLKVSGENKEYASLSNTRRKIDSIYRIGDTTQLKEVTVTADKKEKPGETPSLYGIMPDLTIYPEERGAIVDIFQLLRGIPGLQVTGTGFDTQIGIRNGGSPLWIVDGFPVSNGVSIPINVASTSSGGDGNGSGNSQPPPGINGSRGGIQNSSGLNGATSDPAGRRPTSPVPDFVKNFSVDEIEKIEVHKGASSGAFSGLRGKSGVIIIYTKQGVKRITSPIFNVFGHAVTKEFYSPKYNIPKGQHNIPDYRATLYWNPGMRTDSNGKATIEFFNSDAAENIQVSIEALSSGGIPGHLLKKFEGEK